MKRLTKAELEAQETEAFRKLSAANINMDNIKIPVFLCPIFFGDRDLSTPPSPLKNHMGDVMQTSS